MVDADRSVTGLMLLASCRSPGVDVVIVERRSNYEVDGL